jgi:hypothetical protein
MRSQYEVMRAERIDTRAHHINSNMAAPQPEYGLSAADIRSVPYQVVPA